MSKKGTANAFTHIIVGAGSAGCLLANRLSADPTRSVLLLEAGFDGRYYPWHQIPVGYLFCIGNPKTDWNLRLEPCEGLNGRSITLPRGKGLGGCSSINGMIYMRGQVRDYERWADLTGDDRWSWDKVLPRFKKHEHYWGGTNEYHNGDKELYVSKQRLRWDVLDGFADAAVQYGVPRTTDYNRGNNEGVACFDVNQRNGLRCSSNHAFLQPIRAQRPNLTVLTHAEAGKLRINPKTKTVEGVEVHAHGAATPTVYSLDPQDSRSEVIVAAGSLKSPQLLQVSGIGPESVLKEAGVNTIVNLPGVGGNLQDHLQIRAELFVKNCATLNCMVSSPIQVAKMGLEYLWSRSGPLSMSPSQLGVIMKSDPTQKNANLTFHVQPLSLDAFGKPLHKFPAITASVANLNPTSRGYLHIRSGDGRQAPKIQMNYLQSEEDKAMAIRSFHLVRSIAGQPAFAKYLVGERRPGKEVVSDEALLKAAGDLSTTIFHPVGTCAMGKATDEMAVVTADLKVRGVERLRVIDASVMPYITSGNTNCPTMMIAETGAESIMST